MIRAGVGGSRNAGRLSTSPNTCICPRDSKWSRRSQQETKSKDEEAQRFPCREKSERGSGEGSQTGSTTRWCSWATLAHHIVSAGGANHGRCWRAFRGARNLCEPRWRPCDRLVFPLKPKYRCTFGSAMPPAAQPCLALSPMIHGPPVDTAESDALSPCTVCVCICHLGCFEASALLAAVCCQVAVAQARPGIQWLAVWSAGGLAPTLQTINKRRRRIKSDTRGSYGIPREKLSNGLLGRVVGRWPLLDSEVLASASTIGTQVPTQSMTLRLSRTNSDGPSGMGPYIYVVSTRSPRKCQDIDILGDLLGQLGRYVRR